MIKRKDVKYILAEIDRDIELGFIIERERGMGMSDYCNKKLAELYNKKKKDCH